MEKSKNHGSEKRLAIACGGTGGHFYPGLSIARRVQTDGGQALLFLSGRHTAEQSETAARYNIPVITVRSAPLNHPALLPQIWRGTGEAMRALKKFRPDALLAMGSFASFTSSVAARLLNIPIYLHDGNARVGKANRLLSYLARHLGVAFPPVNGNKLHCPHSVTGMPLRPELLADWRKDISKAAAIKRLNQQYGTALSPDRATLLIFGGSQGAATLNELFPKAMRRLDREDFQVIHLSGRGKLSATQKIYRGSQFAHLLLESSADMALLYRATDAVICRSGGSSIAELLLFGKFAFLLPYPYAAELHQHDNAEYMVSTGAAEVIYPEDCNLERAVNTLQDWLENVESLRQRGLRGQRFAVPEASDNMLKIIYWD